MGVFFQGGTNEPPWGFTKQQEGRVSLALVVEEMVGRVAQGGTNEPPWGLR